MLVSIAMNTQTDSIMTALVAHLQGKTVKGEYEDFSLLFDNRRKEFSATFVHNIASGKKVKGSLTFGKIKASFDKTFTLELTPDKVK